MYNGRYEYHKNNYRRAPTKNSPTEIFNYNWARIKRDIALGVLNQDLPLTAVEEAEHAADLEVEYEQMVAEKGKGGSGSEPVEPFPTNAAAYLDGGAEIDEADVSWRTSGSRGYMPAQTGVSGADDGDGHMMRRRKEHLAAHRQGHVHGHH